VFGLSAWHMDCFRKLVSLPGFSGSIIPGTSAELGRGVDGAIDVDDTTCWNEQALST
jgi:hypothetical protein